jgi:hypothetical protein
MMISIFWFQTGGLTNILLINLSISILNKFDKSKENRQIIYRRSYRCSATKRCSTRRSNINALIQTNDNHCLCFASIPALIVYHSSNINTPLVTGRSVQQLLPCGNIKCSANANSRRIVRK